MKTSAKAKKTLTHGTPNLGFGPAKGQLSLFGAGGLEAEILATEGLNPPVPNRGGKLQGVIAVGIDWFQGTFPRSSLDRVLAILDFWIGSVQLSNNPVAFRGFNFCKQYENGASISWDDSSEWGYVRLPGKFFGTLEKLSAESCAEELWRAGIKCTRIDLFRDDYRKEVSPYDLYQLCEQDKLRVKKVYGYFSSFDGKLRGSTLYLGRRGDSGCGSYVRYYDKSQVREDRDDCYRLEVEFTGSKARSVCEYVFGDIGGGLEAYRERLERTTIGQFDFSTETKQASKYRYTRHILWGNIIKNCNPYRVVVPKRPSSLLRAIDAFSRQWGSLLTNISSFSNEALRGLLASSIFLGTQRGYKSPRLGSNTRLSGSIAIAQESGTLDMALDLLRSRLRTQGVLGTAF